MKCENLNVNSTEREVKATVKLKHNNNGEEGARNLAKTIYEKQDEKRT